MRSILISRLKYSREGKQLPHFQSVEFPAVSEIYSVSPSASQGSWLGLRIDFSVATYLNI